MGGATYEAGMEERLTYKPEQVRPRAGWVVALAEPRKKMYGLIYASPNESGVEKVTEGSAVIVRVGKGEKNELLGIKAGDRICYRSYLRHANRIWVDEKWPDGDEKVYFIMSTEDIMCVMAEGVEVGVLSGRPQVPSK